MPVWSRMRRRRQGRFQGSVQYWEDRYRAGGTSGAGSYGDYARFKADVVNRIVTERGVTSVVELGCGDGNQLGLLELPPYVGLDVAPTAVKTCIQRFTADASKSFFLYHPDCFVDRGDVFLRDCALSQEVLFHLVEDEVFDTYMTHLFASAGRFVLICAADLDWPVGAHERHREFTRWITTHRPDWHLVERVASRYPYDHASDTGFLSDFFLFERGTPS